MARPAAESGSNPNWTVGLKTRRADVSALIVLSIVAIGFYLFRFGWDHLRPTNIDWMLLGGDPATYFIGWSYFRFETWGWPLGSINGYLAPIGTSIPLVDALPLLAFPFKLLSPLLPKEFQYFGLWTCACHVLQVCFGYVLFGHLTRDIRVRFLGALCMLLVPSLLLRYKHIALASHWILLAASGVYFRLQRASLRVRASSWAALVLVASLVHPYLTVMALGIAAADWARDAYRATGWRRLASLVVPVGLFFLVLGSFHSAGHLIYAGDTNASTEGFGRYSMNVNALVNPMRSSTILPDQELWNEFQREGLNYAGVGFLFLGIVAVIGALKARSKPRVLGRHGPLLVAMLLFSAFALSWDVTWGSRLLFHYDLPTALHPLLGALRGSGRFFWPVFYVGLFSVIWLVVRAFPRPVAIAALALALILQIVDLRGILVLRPQFESPFATSLTHPGWELAAARANAIKIYPPFRYSFGEKEDFKQFGWLGARHRIPVWTGYTARLPEKAPREVILNLRDALHLGYLDRRSLYVVEPGVLPLALGQAVDEGWKADRWNGYAVLVPPGFETGAAPVFAGGYADQLGTYISKHAEHTLLIAAKDDAKSALQLTDTEVFREMGMPIDNLQFRGSFAAVIARGDVRWFELDNDDEIRKSFGASSELAGWVVPETIEIQSSGYLYGNRASIKVKDKEYSFNGRGFNVVRLDENFEVVEVAVFDTHRGGPGGVVKLAR